jgi:hypothetical protein
MLIFWHFVASISPFLIFLYSKFRSQFRGFLFWSRSVLTDSFSPAPGVTPLSDPAAPGIS